MAKTEEKERKKLDVVGPMFLMLQHCDAIEMAVSHFSRTVSAVFLFMVFFLMFIRAFRRNSCVLFFAPSHTATRWYIEALDCFLGKCVLSFRILWWNRDARRNRATYG